MPAGSAAILRRPSSGAGAACGAGLARHSGPSRRSWTAPGPGSRAAPDGRLYAAALCSRVMQGASLVVPWWYGTDNSPDHRRPRGGHDRDVGRPRADVLLLDRPDRRGRRQPLAAWPVVVVAAIAQLAGRTPDRHTGRGAANRGSARRG